MKKDRETTALNEMLLMNDIEVMPPISVYLDAETSGSKNPTPTSKYSFILSLLY